jgi:transposase InsO family protein
MSWSVSKMSERAEFVRLAQVPGQEFKQACERFRISRKTGYKWLKRWQAEGDAGLVDQSRRPKESPGKSAVKVEASVLKLRGEHPRWGGRKLRQRLLDQGQVGVPSASTITAILDRQGLLSEIDGAGQPRGYQRFEHASPNDLWQMDFKGHFALVGGGRCHPLTDNGAPWGDEGGQPWTIVTSWLVRLGIRVSHIRPHHPQTQGKDERFHRTLKAEVLRERSFRDLAACQVEFDPWREVYNQERPHEALGLKVPSSRYRLSARGYPETLPVIEYGSGVEVRKVRTDNLISFHGYKIRIGKAFKGSPVGVRATSTEGLYEVFYCEQRIGWANLRDAEHGAGRTLSLVRSLED